MGKGKKVDYGLGFIAVAINLIFGIKYIITGEKLIFAIIHLAVAVALVVMMYLIKKADDDIDKIIESIVRNEDISGTYKDIKLETMVIPITKTILLRYTHDMDFDSVKSVFDDVTTAFPNNVVVAIPDKTTMHAMNLNQLEEVLSTVQSAVDYARNSQSEQEEPEKEVIAE